jgi:PDZ domain-containing protein
MINKLYEEIISMVRENYKYIFFLLIFYFVLTIPLPYYIHTKGGLIDISSRVELESEKDKSGSINLSYVTEMDGTVLTYFLSYIIPGWDLVNKRDYVSSNETASDVEYRNQLLLDEANANAVMVAYNEASKKVVIKNKRFYVAYVDDRADTTLKVGDEIISIEGKKISSMEDYIGVVTESLVGDNLNILVIDKDKKEVNRMAKVFEVKKRNVTGILITPKMDYEANPKIKFKFNKSESGPSGGLMMAIAIYNKLIIEDLTKGLTIVGTGTIDLDGNVGEISGIEYKLKGAIDAKADIFFAPLGDNYEEVKKLVKKNNYDIKIVGVSTFRDAINYLRSV